MKKEMKAAGIFAKAGQKKLAAHERREAAGKEKDTPAIAKKEMSVLNKAKAPKDVMDYEKKEHSDMGFSRGGGIAQRGNPTTKYFAKGGKIKRYNGDEDGSEVENDNTDAEGYGTKLERAAPTPTQDYSPAAFRKAYAAAKARGDKEFKWKRPDGRGYTVAVRDAGSKPPTAQAQTKHMINTMRNTEKDVAAKKNVADVAKANTVRATNSLQSEINRAQAKRERDMGSYGKDVSMYRSGGSIKKYARGGGIESKGKTRGKFI